jgi:hypothetical protein
LIRLIKIDDQLLWQFKIKDLFSLFWNIDDGHLNQQHVFVRPLIIISSSNSNKLFIMGPQDSNSTPSRKRKAVAFAAVEIIELPYGIGAGAPNSGIPISVEWIPQDRSVFGVDFFEQYRPKRRSLQQLRLSDERRQFL